LDALPIHEANDIPYRSKHDGRMRAATTATRPCYWVQGVTSPRHATSPAA
jgi:hypothetical protein